MSHSVGTNRDVAIIVCGLGVYSLKFQYQRSGGHDKTVLASPGYLPRSYLLCRTHLIVVNLYRMIRSDKDQKTTSWLDKYNHKHTWLWFARDLEVNITNEYQFFSILKVFEQI